MTAVAETVSKLRGYPSARQDDGTDPCHLYIKGLPENADELYMYNIFAPFGAVLSVHVMRKSPGVCKGGAFVRFGIPEDATMALRTIHGNQLPDGHVFEVTVKPAAAKP